MQRIHIHHVAVLIKFAVPTYLYYIPQKKNCLEFENVKVPLYFV